MFPSSSFERTELIVIIARVSLTSNGLRLLRWIVSVMWLLTGQRILSTACDGVMPCTAVPSRCVIRSPGLMSARAAGV
jgi:hypothetical protein